MFGKLVERVNIWVEVLLNFVDVRVCGLIEVDCVCILKDWMLIIICVFDVNCVNMWICVGDLEVNFGLYFLVEFY